MKEVDAQAFKSLFREAYRTCFSHEVTAPLTEAESHHFSNEIFERTGLVIGWKSLKNYSHYVLGTPQSKPENPSPATLDTLARYAAGAPVTDEVQRKRHERHYPYWFQYKEAVRSSDQDPLYEGTARRSKWPIVLLAIGAVVMLLAIVSIVIPAREYPGAAFTEDFRSVEEDSLFRSGWFVRSMNADYWKQRAMQPGHLTLFTLQGDNWPDSSKALDIQNLLLREVPYDCFIVELHLSDFFPKQNWQQAGLLLLEDTTLAGRSLRMSIGYNDYSGGFAGSREVIIQAITSLGRDFRQPEEIAHHQLFVVEQGLDSLIRANLAHAALRIEKQGDDYRLLYANGPMKNAAFKEVVRTAFSLRPKYVGLFALKGFVSQADDMPVLLDAFSLTSYPCEDS